MVGNGTDVALLRFGETLINTTEVRDPARSCRLRPYP